MKIIQFEANCWKFVRRKIVWNWVWHFANWLMTTRYDSEIKIVANEILTSV